MIMPVEPEAATPSSRDEPGEQNVSPGNAMLVVDRGPQQGQQIRLNQSRIQIGRAPGADIVLDDVTVSRQHAVIERESGRYVVTDSGSLNGTYVNRNPVDQKAVLNEGDELRIGIFRLIFHG